MRQPAFFRERPVVIFQLARGRFPYFRVDVVSLAFPGPLMDPSGLSEIEKRLSGYSGGTAQAFDLLPFYPPFMEAP